MASNDSKMSNSARNGKKKSAADGGFNFYSFMPLVAWPTDQRRKYSCNRWSLIREIDVLYSTFLTFEAWPDRPSDKIFIESMLI